MSLEVESRTEFVTKTSRNSPPTGTSLGRKLQSKGTAMKSVPVESPSAKAALAGSVSRANAVMSTTLQIPAVAALIWSHMERMIRA